jgi:predicted glycosyltransferase
MRIKLDGARSLSLAMYWHNGRSLGHTARAAKISRSILSASSTTSIAGVTGAYRGLSLLPEGMDVFKLPSFANYDDPDGWHLTPRLAISPTELYELRSKLIATFMETYAPELFLVDHLPEGAEGELRSTLDARRTRHNVLILRGVLFDKEKTQREYFDAGPADWIVNHFCQINVHTHPGIFQLEQFYDVPKEIASRLHYSGYLRDAVMSDREARMQTGLEEGERVIVCSMGGGQGAGAIWQAITESLLSLAKHWDRALLITGPYLEDDAFVSLERAWSTEPRGRVEQFEPRLAIWMKACNLFIGAGGSNMLGELLGSSCNALVIPRQVRETEQAIHTARLEELGLVRTISMTDVTSDKENLRTAILHALHNPLRPDISRYLDDGQSYLAHLPVTGGTTCACLS